MGLGEDLRLLAEQIKKRVANIRGEEGTKQALVLPFFQVLGYDIYDPGEVQPEYKADFAKKRSNGQMEKVDYALHLNGRPAIFVECKAVDEAPADHDGQLARYFNATQEVRVAVVTNGVLYRFFTDLQAPNVIDAAPFFEFDVANFADRDVELLRPFTRAVFSPAAVQSYAEEVIFTNKITGLVGDLLRNPSENFVRFLLGEIEVVQGRLTAKVVERFSPIVRKAVHTTLLEMMTKSIQQEIANPGPASAPPAPTPKPAEAPPEKRVAETTAEELEVFKVVSKICAESTIKSTLGYKDTLGYFAINLGKVSRWFLRVYTNGSKKYAVTRVPLDTAKMLAKGFEVDDPPGEAGKSRVVFAVPADFEKLRSLVLTAYEDETKRADEADS